MPRPTVHPAAVAIFLFGLGALVGAAVWNALRDQTPAAPITRISDSASRQPQPLRDRTPRVVVTVPPLAWAVRALAPQGTPINTLVPPGAGCHAVELTPAQVLALGEADLVVAVGLGLDDAVTREVEAGAQGSARLLRFESLLQPDELVESLCTHGHDHAGDHDHHHHAPDPHAWLDPMLMQRLVTAVETALTPLTPEADREALRARAEAARARCAEIHAAYAAALEPFKGAKLVTHHDAYGYLARRYGLEVVAVIQHQHEVEPTPGDIDAAARAIRDERVKSVFVEPQFSQSAARRIADAAGARLQTLDPLGDGDWPALMQRNLDALVAGLRE